MAVGQFMKTAAERDYSKHWQLEGTFPWMFQQPKPPIEGNRPISPRDNYIRCVKGEKPYWMPAYSFETNIIWPDAMEEHPVPEVDGYDWWGVNWIMVETAGGMITKPASKPTAPRFRRPWTRSGPTSTSVWRAFSSGCTR